ncbi:MAG: PGF-CTERM sorting domain-containing protein [archaeon]|nr:PGF-CTERM sorting domain-containing protein [archaeon]
MICNIPQFSEQIITIESGVTPEVTPTPSPTPTPTPPGFEAVFAIAGLLTVAYRVLRRR